VLAGIVAAACGSDGPTSPGPPSPPPVQSPQIPTDRGGFDVSSDERACTAKTPAWGFFGPRATSVVTITAEAEGFVVRAEAPRYGDFEVRLALSGTGAADAVVTGTMRGTAIDLFSIVMFPNPSRAAVSGAAPGQDTAALTGTFLGNFGGATGTLSGTVVYTDNQGGVMTCTEGSWLLFPSAR
jgi:hypothetical protein